MGRPNILERGECLRGHPIRSEADLAIQRSKARTSHTCRVCKRMRDAEGRARRRKPGYRGEGRGRPPRAAAGQYRRYVYFACGHSTVFDPHPGSVPNIEDTVFCLRCNEYTVVSQLGEAVPRRHYNYNIVEEG